MEKSPSIPTTSQRKNNEGNDGEENVNIETIKKEEDAEKNDGASLRSPPPPPPTTAGKKQKNGHRRVDRAGGVSYKRVPTNALMGAIQLGIANSLGSLAAGKPKSDVEPLPEHFRAVGKVHFPSEGSLTTPPHQFGDFHFKTYAPSAFRRFRELFGIKPEDFEASFSDDLKELPNPGASGSIFYVSADDKFIIKTVQHKEAELLMELLPAYYRHHRANPGSTFLPQFSGLYRYQTTSGKNIRLLVMNNLFPKSIEIHRKFDLKGSTHGRRASAEERAKAHPTLKDLDFNESGEFGGGIFLPADTFHEIVGAVERDSEFLKSFGIMDYSLLIGIHKCVDGAAPPPDHDHQRGYWAVDSSGEKSLLIFFGIIDILQSYGPFKKAEHAWKSFLHDGTTISVTNPTFYAQRFQQYVGSKVFRRG